MDERNGRPNADIPENLAGSVAKGDGIRDDA
jgi:hypothetical protein